MPDTWGDEGPPDDAYSRVTRDLASVTAGYAAYLDALPSSLERDYLCTVRPVTARELRRLEELEHGGYESAPYAVQPEGAGRATILVGRTTYEGGASATLAFGVATSADFPMCFCDACDEDSDSLVRETTDFVRPAVEGCVEFRTVRRRGLRRWTETGYRTAHGSASTGGVPGARGEPFSRTWRPWLPR